MITFPSSLEDQLCFDVSIELNVLHPPKFFHPVDKQQGTFLLKQDFKTPSAKPCQMYYVPKASPQSELPLDTTVTPLDHGPCPIGACVLAGEDLHFYRGRGYVLSKCCFQYRISQHTDERNAIDYHFEIRAKKAVGSAAFQSREDPDSKFRGENVSVQTVFAQSSVFHLFFNGEIRAYGGKLLITHFWEEDTKTSVSIIPREEFLRNKTLSVNSVLQELPNTEELLLKMGFNLYKPSPEAVKQELEENPPSPDALCEYCRRKRQKSDESLDTSCLCEKPKNETAINPHVERKHAGRLVRDFPSSGKPKHKDKGKRPKAGRVGPEQPSEEETISEEIHSPFYKASKKDLRKLKYLVTTSWNKVAAGVLRCSEQDPTASLIQPITSAQLALLIQHANAHRQKLQATGRDILMKRTQPLAQSHTPTPGETDTRVQPGPEAASGIEEAKTDNFDRFIGPKSAAWRPRRGSGGGFGRNMDGYRFSGHSMPEIEERREQSTPLHPNSVDGFGADDDKNNTPEEEADARPVVGSWSEESSALRKQYAAAATPFQRSTSIGSSSRFSPAKPPQGGSMRRSPSQKDSFSSSSLSSLSSFFSTTSTTHTGSQPLLTRHVSSTGDISYPVGGGWNDGEKSPRMFQSSRSASGLFGRPASPDSATREEARALQLHEVEEVMVLDMRQIHEFSREHVKTALPVVLGPRDSSSRMTAHMDFLRPCWPHAHAALYGHSPTTLATLFCWVRAVLAAIDSHLAAEPPIGPSSSPNSSTVSPAHTHPSSHSQSAPVPHPPPPPKNSILDLPPDTDSEEGEPEEVLLRLPSAGSEVEGETVDIDDESSLPNVLDFGASPLFKARQGANVFNSFGSSGGSSSADETSSSSTSASKAGPLTPPDTPLTPLHTIPPAFFDAPVAVLEFFSPGHFLPLSDFPPSLTNQLHVLPKRLFYLTDDFKLFARHYPHHCVAIYPYSSAVLSTELWHLRTLVEANIDYSPLSFLDIPTLLRLYTPSAPTPTPTPQQSALSPTLTPQQNAAWRNTGADIPQDAEEEESEGAFGVEMDMEMDLSEIHTPSPLIPENAVTVPLPHPLAVGEGEGEGEDAPGPMELATPIPLDTPTPNSHHHDFEALEGVFKELRELAPLCRENLATGSAALYVGSLDAVNAKCFAEHTISHVVSFFMLTDELEALEAGGAEMLVLGLNDATDAHTGVYDHLPTILYFTLNALAQKNRVLIHCQKGQSRSTTLMLAVLLFLFNIPLVNLLSFLKNTRPIADPNMGFWVFLLQWEQYLRGKWSAYAFNTFITDSWRFDESMEEAVYKCLPQMLRYWMTHPHYKLYAMQPIKEVSPFHPQAPPPRANTTTLSPSMPFLPLSDPIPSANPITVIQPSSHSSSSPPPPDLNTSSSHPSSPSPPDSPTPAVSPQDVILTKEMLVELIDCLIGEEASPEIKLLEQILTAFHLPHFEEETDAVAQWFESAALSDILSVQSDEDLAELGVPDEKTEIVFMIIDCVKMVFPTA